MPDTFTPGDIVDVTIQVRGARVTDADQNKVYIVDGSGTGNWSGSLKLDDPAVTVVRTAPPQWPPQPGDLWRTNIGTLWFAQQHFPAIAMVPAQLAADDARLFLTPDELLSQCLGSLALEWRGGQAAIDAGVFPVGHHPRHPNGASTVEAS